jgi:hypothetical protein
MSSESSPVRIAWPTIPLYRPEISPARYLHTFHLYLNVLFYQDHFWRDANTILLVVAMLAVGVWQRSRPLLVRLVLRAFQRAAVHLRAAL